MSAWVSAIGSIASAAVAMLATVVAVTAYRSQLFELARSLHQDLTTGTVQEARNILGSVHHSGHSINNGNLDRTLEGYFRLLWCFERIEAGRQLMTRRRLGRDARTYLDKLILWHVGEWARNFGQSKTAGDRIRTRLNTALQPHGLQDEESWAAFERLADELGCWDALSEAADDSTTPSGGPDTP